MFFTVTNRKAPFFVFRSCGMLLGSSKHYGFLIQIKIPNSKNHAYAGAWCRHEWGRDPG